jgi:RNA polymerase sigma-70 factor (ECF subfamily)
MSTSGYEADRELARALSAGDTDAAHHLCETYLPRLHTFILERSGLSAEAAADVAQETLVAALRSVQHYRGESSLFTWLAAIARRKTTDHYRRERRRPLSLEDVTARGLALIDDGPLPDEVAQSDETAAAVHQALWRLPVRQREVLLLKYVDELPVAEIAADLGRSEKSVESLLSRGRAALRQQLVEWGLGRRRSK